MKKITVVIIDDHQLVREMWSHMFTGHQHFEVVGESGDFESAIGLVKSKRPDIALLDINLPPASGLDAVPLIRKFSPGTKIIAVSVHNQPAYAKKMIKLGAKGYLTKNSSRSEVFHAIEEAINGKLYLCSEVKENLAAQLLSDQPVQPSLKDLSLREIEVVRLIRNGLSSKEIAGALQISVRTAEVHRHNILKKMRVKNTASLISFLNSTDLISD